MPEKFPKTNFMPKKFLFCFIRKLDFVRKLARSQLSPRAPPAPCIRAGATRQFPPARPYYEKSFKNCMVFDLILFSQKHKKRGPIFRSRGFCLICFILPARVSRGIPFRFGFVHLVHCMPKEFFNFLLKSEN